MSFDEEDERKYLGYAISATASASAARPKGQNKKKMSFLVEEDDDEEDDRRRPKKQVSRKRDSESEAIVEDEAFNDFIRKLEKQGKRMNAVAARKPLSRRKISTRAKLACITLMQEADDIRLTNDTKEEVEMIMQCTDDGTIVDPQITIYASVPTGTCQIYMKEVVPLSLFLIALACKAMYFVQVTGKSKSTPANFDSVVCKPYKGDAEQQPNMAQPFELEKIINDQLAQEGQEDKIDQVMAYMYVIGPVSSQDACDREFIETHLEQVKRIFSGEFILVEQKSAPRKSAILEEDDE